MKNSVPNIYQEKKKDSLTDSFLQYFTVDLATTPAQKESVFKIRYRVYCEEFEYEPADRFPNKIEHDAYDDHSLHCLITHNSSGKPAGCVRLIPALGDENHDILPFETACSGSLDTELIQSFNIDRKTVCELSRLAVDGMFRRRAGETQTRFGDIDALDISHQERRSFELIAVAAFMACTALTDLTGRTNIFAMMEPFLPRLLRRSGIIFHKVGNNIDFHGIRAPYYVQRTQAAMDKVHPDLKKLYEVIFEKIKQSYRVMDIVG